ncbi:type IV secretion system protein [Lysobacter sp. CA199]|uniref:type IV secretion system protein n=1 Tax=Lysobacter sp. CA199 TaxID=3455608 RepID=UPI003F8D69BF
MDSHMVSLGAGSLLDWMHMQAGDLPAMAFFALIKNHLDTVIAAYQDRLLDRVGKIIGAFAATAVTLWIVVQGFRIATGQSREPMMGLVVNSLKSVLIVGIALSAAVTADRSYSALTDGLSSVVRQVMTGRDDEGPYEDMDKILGVLQVGLETVDSVDVGDSLMTNETKQKSMDMIGVGLGAPVIMAMIAMMLNKIAMALFIGTGPFFILCLLFDQTKALFQKWLFFGIATMMTMAVLITMTTIAIDMTLAVGGAFWVTNRFGLGSESLMSMALQQGGLGMILSALIITAPPMAGMFFNGVMGSYYGTNNFPGQSAGGGGGGGGNAPANSYRPGSPGYQPPPVAPVREQVTREQTSRGQGGAH